VNLSAKAAQSLLQLLDAVEVAGLIIYALRHLKVGPSLLEVKFLNLYCQVICQASRLMVPVNSLGKSYSVSMVVHLWLVADLVSVILRCLRHIEVLDLLVAMVVILWRSFVLEHVFVNNLGPVVGQKLTRPFERHLLYLRTQRSNISG
jgi:hypothetical protein